MSKAGEFLLSVFLPVAGGNTLVSVYRIKVDNTIEWVKAHADEIAAQALGNDARFGKVNGGVYVALNVEPA